MVVSCKAKKAQSVYPSKKHDHYCESFAWQNGFAIFKNVMSYFKNLHGNISDLQKDPPFILQA